jgi:hypothetical protein
MFSTGIVSSPSLLSADVTLKLISIVTSTRFVMEITPETGLRPEIKRIVDMYFPPDNVHS